MKTKIFYKKSVGVILLLIVAFLINFLAVDFDRSEANAAQKPAAKPAAKIVKVSKNPIADKFKAKLAKQSAVKKFKSLDELKQFLEKNTGQSSYYNSYGSRGTLMLEDMAVAPMANAGVAKSTAVAESTAGSADYSKTNVQVEGVDEGDIIKSDGKYIYAVVNQDLFIINAYPAGQGTIISKIAFKSRPQELYVSGNRLVVLADDNEIYATPMYSRFIRRSQYSILKVFDIADKKNPKLLSSINFEGSLSGSRLIGDYVYLITTAYNNYYYNETPLPRIIRDGKEISMSLKSGKCPRCPDVYYFDMPYQNVNMTNVAAVNIQDPKKDITNQVYFLAGNQDLYVSLNNIYITYTKYISESDLAFEVAKEIITPRLPAYLRDRITKIEATDDMVLTPAEKISKINILIERYQGSLPQKDQEKLAQEITARMKAKYNDISKELEKTVVHKIAINKEKLEYKTFGEVTGQVLNQFSMDEKDGLFRIATTKNTSWSQFFGEDSTHTNQSYNNLYVLDANLKTIGRLEGLAKGEKIYSVRFMQDRAYMVTFKQTDPLFVFDLSNPSKPLVLGELKLPGFSNYLHPYDDDTLIGIGKQTEENSWGGANIKGIKLTLFDVANISKPKLIDEYEMGERGSDSIALSDHKAFLFSKAKNLLVIPVSLYEKTSGADYPRFSFGGAAVFNVDKTGFKLKGKIDHSDGGQPGVLDYWGGYNYYSNTVKRSLYISDTLYTFSDQYLQANKLANLEQVLKLELKKEKDSDYEVIN
jgi:inhibitor of cysteine peptidase